MRSNSTSSTMTASKSSMYAAPSPRSCSRAIPAVAKSNLVRIVVSYASAQTDDRPLRVDITPAGMVRSCDPLITSTSDPRRCL